MTDRYTCAMAANPSPSTTTTTSSSTAAPPTASALHSTQSDALVAALENSDSATVYVDIDGMTDAGASELLLAEPPLHLEFDQVRQQWAVRYATADEAAEAQAAADEAAPKAPPSGKSTTTT